MPLPRERSLNSVEQGPSKRAKVSNMNDGDGDVVMLDLSLSGGTNGNNVIKKSSNTSLKGRKRFNKDLEDVFLSLSSSSTIFGVQVEVKKAEDEGSFVLSIFTLPSSPSQLSVELTYLISEISDYPHSHTFFTFSSSPITNNKLKKMQDQIPNRDGMTVQEETVEFVFGFAKVVGVPRLPSSAWNAATSGKADESEEELTDDGEEYDPFEGMDGDDDDDVLVIGGTSDSSGGGWKKSGLDLAVLRSHFEEITSHGYRPGLIRFSSDDFLLSASVPITQLTSPSSGEMNNDMGVHIPPLYLQAWDRRLLSHPPYHLTLLITGCSGVYPLIPTTTGGIVQLPYVKAEKGGLRFKVGLTDGGYKPRKDVAKEVTRTFGLVDRAASSRFGSGTGVPGGQDVVQGDDPTAAEEEEEDGGFERFSMSSSLESLLDEGFIPTLNLRLKYNLTWGGAEKLYGIMIGTQLRDEDILARSRKEIQRADEIEIKRASKLPYDSLIDYQNAIAKGKNAANVLNLPLLAYTYTLRRLLLCTEFCVVCHMELHDVMGGERLEVMKPFVCKKDLCRYQYYVMGAGPSLEYEILHNPSTVDLLVSLAYASASEQVMEDPWPTGMNLTVSWQLVQDAMTRFPNKRVGSQYMMNANNHRVQNEAQVEEATTPPVDADGNVLFDLLGKGQMRSTLCALLDTIPPIPFIRNHLQQKVKHGQVKPSLRDVKNEKGELVRPESWGVLRWCVGSCTAYLEEITDKWELIGGLDPSWRQFRFSVGAPEAETKFKGEFIGAQEVTNYPSTYAFHGSPLRNWHSIIRHGLWAKTITHGRAYGDGVYLAKEGQTSMGSYASGASRSWRNSAVGPMSCTALAEIINLPERYVSNNPHIVIKDTHWIMCRYLIVKGTIIPDEEDFSANANGIGVDGGSVSSFSSSSSPTISLPRVLKRKSRKYELKTKPKLFKFDPKQKITMSGKPLEIPVPEHRVDQLVGMMMEEDVFYEVDEEDQGVFAFDPSKAGIETGASGKGKGKEVEVIEISSDDDGDDNGSVVEIDDLYADDDVMIVDSGPAGRLQAKRSGKAPEPRNSSISKSKGKSKPSPKSKPKDDWKHDPEWVRQCTANLFPPPITANPAATQAVQRELRAMLKEQENANSLKELGWNMPEEFMGDNMFQWIVEMHSFDPDIPIAKDMKKEKINSIVFEIRFPETFPMSPPFFMIKGPRFLPFIHGGGGHVTGGGSICMDLLTSDGWLPSYNIPAVLMQIKLAISNLDPRPARLAKNWKMMYNVHEALEGYKRAAATHGWSVPPGLEKLIR